MRTCVAVSGGVDSLFTLILLKEQGEDVVAVHGRFLEAVDHGNEDALALACEDLGVPFHVVDLRREFAELVVDPFCAAYAAGRTPNPCAGCNAHIKFGLLLDRAAADPDIRADRVATGHYAVLRDDMEHGRVLVRGADPAKEQSYFLSLVPRERLARAVFPLGSMTKEEVKAEVARRGIVPPLVRESQEVCFVPDDDYRAFLEARVAAGRMTALGAGGSIVGPGGTVLGRHDGLWRYTIGQRRGLGIAYSEPLYVIGKDLERNVLLVGVKGDLDAVGCEVREVNWLVPFADWPDALWAKTRYRQQAVRVAARQGDGDSLVLRFLEPETRPAPGQVAAVYDESGTVLAGGILHG